MSEGITTVIYPVGDLEAAKPVFSALLGVEPVMDQPYYVGYEVDGLDVGLDVGLDPNGHRKGMTGPVPYWRVREIERAVEALVQAGAELQEAPKDVGGGKLIASVKDADGNVIGLLQPA